MRKSGGAIAASNTAKRGFVRPALTAFFLSTAAVSAPFLTPALAQSYSFSNVTIEGNSSIEQATILKYVGIGRGKSVSGADLNDAYQRLVNSGLFESVELVHQGNTLVVKVVELPIINVINFEGNKRLKDDALAKIIKSQSRRVYSPSLAEADAAALAEAYRVQGRIAASVDPRIIRRDGNRVDLVFEITEGRTVEIERLSFVGNRAFSDRRLRQILETKQAGLLRTFIKRDTFVAERLDLDKQLLRDFYQSRGYIDVQILDATSEVSRQRDAFFVTFSIKEGQSFNVGKISTISEVEGVDAPEFEAVQKIRGGQTYTPSLIENNITRMENLALRKGLNFVQVEPRVTRNERDGTVDIQFALVRGQKIFVERIDIEGNTTTLDQVVRRQFRTAEGDPLNPREIRKAAERIRALGFFSDAQVDTAPGANGDQTVVKVDVTEQPTGSLSLGASYSVSSGVGLNVGLSESNFLGRGQAVSLNIQSGTSSTDSNISFTEPAFLGRDLKFSVSAGYRKTSNDNSNYDTRVMSVSPSIEFPISELGRVQLRYKLAQTELTNVSTSSSTILQREQARGALVSSSVGIGYTYDTRVEGLNPNGGVLLRFNQDFGGLGGDAKYMLTSGLALAETKVLKEEVTLRAIFEGGLLTSFGGDTSRVTDRFFGNGKIRGFEANGIGPRDLNAANQDALGGNIFAVARLESDFPLGLPEEYGIGGGVFFDVGSVWSLKDVNGSGGAATVDDSFHLRSAVGFSVFWDTPIGPLRFNFSKALIKQDYDRTQNFDLTISTKF